MIIALCGVDGSGKTTLTKKFESYLKQRRFSVKVINPFRYIFLSLFMKILRRKDDKHTNHLLKKNTKSLLKLWPLLALVDNWLQYLWIKFLSFKYDFIVCDRFFYDFYTSFKYYNYTNKFVSKIYLYLMPKPDITFILNVNYKIAREREKKQKHTLDFYKKQIKNYLELSSISKNTFLLDTENHVNIDKLFSKVSLIREQNMHSLNASTILYFFLLYFMSSIILTYPFFFKMSTNIYGYAGDNLGGIWKLWWFKYSLIHHLDYNKVNVLSFFGYDLSTYVYQPYHRYLGQLIVLFSNPILSYNFINFLSFPLCGLFMFFLIFYLTKSKKVSFVIGFAYSFLPYHFVRAMGHLALANYQWIPFFIYSLFTYFDKPSKKNIFYLYFSLFLNLITSPYYSVMIFLFLGLFLVYKFLIKTPNFFRKLFFLIVIIFVTLISILPFYYKFFSISGIGTHSMYNHELKELYTYSACPLDYILPSVDNPLLGPLIKSFVYSHIRSNIVEQTNYVGITTIFLFILGLLNKRYRKLNNFLLISALIFFLLSLSPTITIFSLKVTMPSLILYKFFPFVRNLNRYGVMLLTIVLMTSSKGLLLIIQKSKRKNLLILIFLLFFTFEFINFPPFKVGNLPVNKMIYYIRDNSNVTKLFILPIETQYSLRYYKYLFWQTIHEKKMVNCNPDFFYRNFNLNNSITTENLNLLYAFNVSHILLEGKNCSVNDNLKFVYSYGNYTLCKLDLKHPSFAYYINKNFYDVEKWTDGVIARWMKDNGTLVIINNDIKARKVIFSFEAIPYNCKKDLNIYLDNKLIGTLTLNCSKFYKYNLSFILTPGKHVLLLKSIKGVTPIENDKREISIAFTNISFKG